MDTNTTQCFSCFLIGEGTLLIRCAEILVNRGHAIHGVISSDRNVHRWAQERNLVLIDPEAEDIVRFLSQQPFDYLFSIVNPLILSKQVLELPRRCAINYHDAPLPKYAGSYATSWAIMQGEREHGITWHVMTDRADAGEIFKQRFFKIDENETAFSLNARCYDAAASSFFELVDDIASGNVSARQQNLNERSFYPLYKRPSSGCVLRWSHSTREIVDFVRALNFGRYDNPLGLPKVAVGMDFVIVQEVEGTDRSSANLPGTITHIDANFMSIATGDSEVILKKLLTIDGQPLGISDFVELFGLYEGYRFQELDQEIAARITTYNASACRYENFWKKYLGTLEKATLPYVQRHALTIQGEQYLHVSMPVPQGVINHLIECHETWSVEDFLLTAFAAYLARLGDIGSFDLAYRDVELKRELAGLEGMFSEYAFLHVDIDLDQTFDEVFHTVSEQVKRTKKRKTYARDIIARFPNLQGEAKAQGAYQPSILVERLATVDHYQVPPGIELAFIILEGGRECLWVYDTSVLYAENIEKIQNELITFIQGSIADPRALVAHLPLITEKERHQFLEEWNATQADYPKERCVHELFEEQAQRAPEAIAVVLEGAQITYQELNRRANQLARHLQQQGVGPEVLVGLCLERSLEMIVGILGVLKAGGAYVPVDPDAPPERFAFILRDSQMAVLLTQKSLLERLPESHLPVMCLDADWQVISQYSQETLPRQGTSQHLAYVIYTSGSTGRPKGVLIEHRSLMAHCWSITHVYELSAADRILQFHAFTFDPSVEQILATLMVGARLILRGEEIWSPGELLNKIKQQQLTTLILPPAYWQQALQEWMRSPQQLLDLPLRVVVVGGERLLPEVVQLWRRTPLDSVRFLNIYGPTETTIAATFYDIAYDQDEGRTEESIPIGRPLANRSIYILDRMGSPVPIGIAGELYIGGVGVARGYLNRSDLTAERFLPDPFSEVPGARLYRTGDIARYRGDGNIEFLSRVDDQVKIRGYRIEPGEVEAALSGHPAIRQSAVVAREDTPGDKYLVAYLVLHAKESVKPNDLKRYMTELVPSYMVPSAFVLLQTLPLMTSGKVDRRALPAPDFSSRTIKEDNVLPEHMLHFQLIAIWEDLLNVHPIGIRDNFFDIGGHSLLAVLLLERIERVFQHKLQFNTLFANPTIEGLAEILQTKVDKDLQLPIIALQAGEAKQPLFFLHGQWRGDAFYCYPLARSLGKEQPFYAIPPYQLSSVTVTPTMEEMAAAHIKTLQSVQPNGPYWLGGWCNGALVAYEMARQLHAQGQAIDALILVNPSPLTPSRRLKSVYKIVSWAGRLFHLSLAKQQNYFLRLNHISLYLFYPGYQEEPEFEPLRVAAQARWDKWGKRSGALLSQLQLLFPPIESLYTYLSVLPWISTNYKPLSQYPGKISFLWHRDEASDRVTWQQVIEANEVEEYYLPGTHTTFLTDHLSDVAKQIQLCLNEASALDREKVRSEVVEPHRDIPLKMEEVVAVGHTNS
jgi:amino acid adenylation domain-containing protein